MSTEEDYQMRESGSKNILYKKKRQRILKVCMWLCVCVCARACIRAAAESAYTLPNTFHNPPFPAACQHPETSND